MNNSKNNSFEDAIWKRIAELLDQRKIKQSHLIAQCKAIGMPITQPEMSKLYNGKKKINVYELTAIAKVLDVSADTLLTGFSHTPKDFFEGDSSNNFLSDGNLEAFEVYYGDYSIYYNATIDHVSKLQQGKMTISKEEDGYCKVVVSIFTGSFKGTTEIVKKYEGRMLITTFLSGAYIILKNQSFGEFCFMIMRHRSYTVQQLECRMALCLTIGAGEDKVPTAHKMLITRKALPEKIAASIWPQLDLYGEAIRIEKSKAQNLIHALDDEGDRIALKKLWQVVPEKQYYEVSIELLRRHLHLSREKFAVFISALLKEAETEPYTKLYAQNDHLSYAIVESTRGDTSG